MKGILDQVESVRVESSHGLSLKGSRNKRAMMVINTVVSINIQQ